MKHVIAAAALLACVAIRPAAGQVRTEETRTSTDSLTGQVTTTRSVAVSRSEDITPYSGLIVINPLKFFLFYNLTYVQRISSQLAIGGGVQTPTLKGINGFGVNAELRVYPSGRSPRGFYFAPNASYNSLSASDGHNITSPVSVGILVGWQWFPGEDFAMGLGIGIDHYSDSGSNDDIFGSYSGNVPALRFDIGYSW